MGSVLCSCSCSDIAAKPADTQKAQIADLIKNINDDPDFLHYDLTPAVYKLIDIGFPALKEGVLELLLSEDTVTRMHAERVVEGVASTEMGFVYGSGWKDASQEAAWQNLLKINGSYQWDSPGEVRRSSYLKWIQWLHDKEGSETGSSNLSRTNS